MQAAALEMGWAEFVSSPLVGDLLWAKVTAGMELDGLFRAATPDQVNESREIKNTFGCVSACRASADFLCCRCFVLKRIEQCSWFPNIRYGLPRYIAEISALFPRLLPIRCCVCVSDFSCPVKISR